MIVLVLCNVRFLTINDYFSTKNSFDQENVNFGHPPISPAEKPGASSCV